MIYLLDKDLKTVGVVPNSKMVEAVETVEINTAKILNVQAVVSESLLTMLQSSNYVAVPSGNRTVNLYRLAPYTVSGDFVTITGTEKFYDDMMYLGYIKDYRPTNKPTREVITQLLDGSGWEIDYLHPTVESRTMTGTYYYTSRFEALSEALGALGVEIEPIVYIDSENNVTGQYVTITTQLGKNNNARYVYGRNVAEISVETNPIDVVSAVLGRGKGEEKENGNYGRRIMFTDIVWSKDKGDPLDKPSGQNYLIDPTANAMYKFPNGQPRLSIQTFEEIETPEELLQASYEWLVENNRPKVEFKSSIYETGQLDIGDTVTIIRNDLNIKYQTRVFKVERNLLNKDFSTIEFGDRLSKTFGDIQTELKDDVLVSVGGQIDQAMNDVILSADGSRITYGYNEPMTKKVGDMWYMYYDDEGVQKTILKVWNGTEWEVVLDENMFNVLDEKINQAVSEIDGAVTSANNAVQKAEDAITKVTNVESNVGEINTLVTANTDEISGLKNRMTDAEGNITVVQQTTTSLQTAMTNAEGDISGLKQTATSIQSDVADLEGNVSTITQTVDGLNSKVTNIDGTVSQLSQTSDAIVSRVEDLEGMEVNVKGQNLISDPNITTTKVSAPTDEQKLTTWQVATLTTVLEPEESKPNRRVLHSPLNESIDSKSQYFVNTDPDGKYTVEFDYRASTTRGSNEIAKLFWVEELGNVGFEVLVMHASDFPESGATEVVGQWQRRKATVTLSSDKIGKGYLYWSTWTANVAEEYYRDLEIYGNANSIAPTFSQISQLSDNINMKVQKGDVINQINISDESILISGQKIHITGSTTIDNAVIKDAMIGSMSANKLTAGTIDASKITVINLNASNITSGSMNVSRLTGNLASFVQTNWNGINSSISITSSGLNTYDSSNKLSSRLNGTGHRFYASGKSIGHIGTGIWTNDSSYRGLAFHLEPRADFMTWSFKESSTDTSYTTRFSWHKTSAKMGRRGFMFTDAVTVPYGEVLYLSTISTNSTSDARRLNMGNGGTWSITGTSDSNAIYFRRGDGGSTIWLGGSMVGMYARGSGHIVVSDTSSGDGYVYSASIYNRTTSAGGNVFISSGGILARSTSASKYKLDIQPADSTRFERILSIEPKTWFDKWESEEKARILTDRMNGFETGDYEPIVKRHTGAIAEDFVEAGLEEFVVYNDEGEVEGLQYERAWLYLVPIIKDLKDKVSSLESQLNA